MKIVLTGGHLSPALCIIEDLPKETEMLFVGRKYTFEGDKHVSFEYQVVNQRKIPFKSITTGRLQRAFTRYTIPSILKFPLGVLQALQIIKTFNPDIILSFGGYISLPIVLAGAIRRIPIVLHEQCLNAGLANKIASIFAKKICVSWEETKKDFSYSKTILTGIPIKKFQISNFKFQISNEKLPLIYITGGSAGSHTINKIVEGCIARLLEKFRVVHQTGDSLEGRDYGRLIGMRKSLSKALQQRYTLTKFINPMDVGEILSSCDLVIARSGANTISEIIFFQKNALLIPLNKEQMQNAMFLKSLGLGEVLDQDKLTPDKLYEKIIQTSKKSRVNVNNAKSILIANASENVISVVKEVLNKSL